MKDNVTFGHVLALLAIIGIPLLTWGVHTETRFEKNNEIINHNTLDIKTINNDMRINEEIIQNNHLEVMLLLKDIKIELKDKAPRN